MPFIPSSEVTSPQESWHLIKVIYDAGEGNIAVAYGEWENESVIAIRWNGTNEPNKGLGNPQSSGHPTWFILPKDFGIAIVDKIIEDNYRKEKLGINI
jgi:predicted membrane-bound dolichyl-phosphate-mannose-protein mannosyltransferase